MREPSTLAVGCDLIDGPRRTFRDESQLEQALSPTRAFSCTGPERAQVGALLGRAVTTPELRRAVSTAIAQAQRDATVASRALRARPRSDRASRIFRSVFNVPPTFVPAWRPRNASWRDLGELVALRLENGSRILGGGYMRFFCWGSAARCPECNKPPTSYRACSSYQGRHHICLGREWWEWYRDGHYGFMASTLLHEAMHIYFRLEHHKATVGRPSVNNMYCYDTLVAILSGRTPKPGDRNKCASALQVPDHENGPADRELEAGEGHELEGEEPHEFEDGAVQPAVFTFDRGSPFDLGGWIGGVQKLRDHLAEVARAELDAWAGLPENDRSVLPILVEYGRAGRAPNPAGWAASAAANQTAWSAGFISYVVEQALIMADIEGDPFNRYWSHSVYITAAKRNREAVRVSNPFWLFKLNEVQPDVGDFICRNRQNSTAVTYANVKRGDQTHVNVVTEIESNRAWLKETGGNRSGDTVLETKLNLTNGFVRPIGNGRPFAILRIRSAPWEGVDDLSQFI